MRVLITARAATGPDLLHTLLYELRIARRERPYVEGLVTTPPTPRKGATP